MRLKQPYLGCLSHEPGSRAVAALIRFHLGTGDHDVHQEVASRGTKLYARGTHQIANMQNYFALFEHSTNVDEVSNGAP